MKQRSFIGSPQKQSGAVLLVSLILLVLLTLFVIAGINFTNIQSRIAGNLQVRNELKSVNQRAIEEVVSTIFTYNPLDHVYTSATTYPWLDVNGDGVADYKVTVKHTCISYKTIPVDQLVITNAEDAACTMTASLDNTGNAGFTPNSASLCATSLWDVAATGTDATASTFKTAASVTTHQGIGIRVRVGTGC